MCPRTPRTTVGWVALCCALFAPGDAWGAPPALSTAEQAVAEQIHEIKVKLDKKSPIDEEAAAKMLAAACRLPANSQLRAEAQMQYGLAIWTAGANSAVAAAQKDAVAAELDLVQVLDRNAALLSAGQVPPTTVAAGRLYLALYQWKLQSPSLRPTLDGLDEPMRDTTVCPRFRAMYWNLRGLQATDESSFALAVDCHAIALDLRRDAGLRMEEAESLNNIGLLLLRIGDYVAAENALLKAHKLYVDARTGSKEGPSEGERVVELNLAKAMEGRREFKKSVERLESALAQVDNQPTQKLLACYFRNNLAVGSYSLGQFARCETELRKCRSELIKLPGAQLQVAETDVNLGWAALALNRKDDAERQFRAALDALRKLDPKHYRVAEVSGYLARVLSLEKRNAEAIRLFNEALARREQDLRDTLASALSERDRLAFVQQFRVHPESRAWPGVFDSYLELAPALAIADDAQYRRLLLWKGALVRSESQVASAGAETDEMRKIKRQQADVRRKLLVLSAGQRTADPQQVEAAARLEQRANELERQWRRLRGALPAPPDLAPAQVAAALPADAALCDIIEVRRYFSRAEGQQVRDDRVYVAFIVTGDGRVRRFDLGSAPEIDSVVKQFYEFVVTQANASVPANKIMELFGRRLRTELGDVRLLIVSADGMLHRLPWCALPGVKQEYWIDELTVATVPSAQSLVARRGRPRAGETEWLAVGGVDYGPPSQKQPPRFAPLANSQTEAMQIDNLLAQRFAPPAAKAPPAAAKQGAVTLLVGREATKARLLELLPQRRFVHIATHGELFQRRGDAYNVIDATGQLDSVLVLAGANSDPTGGAKSLLSAGEVGELDLRQLDLLVLSACDTGLGHIQAGQGIVGLVGALDKAGAATVVGALWKVDDRATALLMESFYRRLLKDRNTWQVAAAVRDAQLSLLRGQDKSFSHPYFWAAWSTIGDPGAR